MSENNSQQIQKKVFYCEICDKVMPKISDRMAHDRNSSHITNCIEYRRSLSNNEQQLKIMAKLLQDKFKFEPKSLDELTVQIVHILAKQHLTNQQITDIRKRKKELQQATNNSTNNPTNNPNQ